MKTLFPHPTSIDQARRQANILARAYKLISTGYRVVQRTRPTLFGIYKPGNVQAARGVWHSDYTVDLHPGHELCTCKGFRNDGDCKHRIAAVLVVEMFDSADAAAAEYERTVASAENERTGCDPYKEF